MAENWKFETQQIHAGSQADPATKSRATPIYRTTAYVFDSAEHAANLFALAEFGNIYSRRVKKGWLITYIDLWLVG